MVSTDKQFTGILLHCYRVRSNWALFVAYGFMMRKFYWSLDKIKAYFQAQLKRFNNLTEENLSYLLEYELILKRDLKVEFTDLFDSTEPSLSSIERLLVNTVLNMGSMDQDFVKNRQDREDVTDEK